MTTASTSLQFFLALALFIAGFTVIYVVGELINGFSALILDRTIVKKLLKYPFTIYQRRLGNPTAEARRFFRDNMLEASYLILCVNLVPLVFLELVSFLFDIRIPGFSLWLQAHRHYYIAAPGLAIILWLHLGRPSLRRARRRTMISDREHVERDREFVRYHILLLLMIFLIEFIAIMILGYVSFVLLLPALNIAIGIAERRLFDGVVDPGPLVRKFYAYAKARFTNPIYFAAKLTGYGDLPSSALIRSARSSIGTDVEERDFFWMTYLTVQNRGGAATQSMYHFLAMYGMVRNLCNATAMVLLWSVAIFWIEWPEGHGHGVAIWSLGLCGLMYGLFIRYLYVYAAYFSKYVLRTAAYIARPSEPLIRL
jgi:hypothetical protein